MNLKIAAFSDRIGPDICLTHWMLHFKLLNKLLIKNKLLYVGEESEIRSYVTIVGGRNISIGNNVVLRSGTQLHASSIKNGAKIIIEDNVLLAPNVFITVNNHNYDNVERPIIHQGGIEESIVLREGSWICEGVKILQGTTVGKNSVVAAGAVVTKSVPDYCVVAGIPAKIIKRFNNGVWENVK